MAGPSKPNLNRRTFLKRSAIAAAAGAAAVGAGSYWLGSRARVSKSSGKKVIVIGIDGMDPVLSETMMNAGRLPNLAKLRATGGFSRLGTSIPPQSPVAWANFINGAGPGSHGIFDFIHRHPHEQAAPFYAAAETVGGQTLLRRQGIPFWDYLDAAGIPSTFYDLPSNYPASPSQHGHHRCISGMGTPDMLGTFGTYQHFADKGPPEPVDEGSGKRFHLTFEADTARANLVGPESSFLKPPRPITVEFLVHRDRQANAAVIEVQGHKILLKAGQWSPWTRLEFELPWYVANVSGISRFYLQEVTPNFRLYVTPVNMDPSAPAQKISEPPSFIRDVSKRLGLFSTTGFQEDYNARKNNVFVDDEFLRQANMVLEERLALFDYAVEDYDDGLLFFYFSSSDLQSHMFWWNSDDKHPIRSDDEAKKYFGHVQQLYQRLDALVGDLADRYGSRATIIVMSDHGFANFGRQFNLNSWLRENGYLGPPQCSSIMTDVDWSLTYAYGLGINGLYLNLKGRERDGIVEPGEKQEELLTELKQRLEEVTDANGERVIRSVYRADQVYSGGATALAPDLIVGYTRGYRASWATCLGDLTGDVLLDNDSAWSADHCADALEVPGVLFCNRPFRAQSPSLVDLAPSILAEFGLPAPQSMSGKSIFS
ncbi:MAG: twin-arginine translocation signal domain-containing protein [Planctomycetota bacterium]|nr:MAG: twin-arginine translocation signal domain-containing protein [Planctomycetota bacterium]